MEKISLSRFRVRFLNLCSGAYALSPQGVQSLNYLFFSFFCSPPPNRFHQYADTLVSPSLKQLYHQQTLTTSYPTSVTGTFVYSPSPRGISKNDLYLLSWLFISDCCFGTDPRHLTTTELVRVTGGSFIVKRCGQFPAYLSGTLDTDDPLFLPLLTFPTKHSAIFLPSTSRSPPISFACLLPLSPVFTYNLVLAWSSGCFWTSTLFWFLSSTPLVPSSFDTPVVARFMPPGRFLPVNSRSIKTS